MPTETIEITREWLERLIELVDTVCKEEDPNALHGWMSHLLGYVHSLDEHLKVEG